MKEWKKGAVLLLSVLLISLACLPDHAAAASKTEDPSAAVSIMETDDESTGQSDSGDAADNKGDETTEDIGAECADQDIASSEVSGTDAAVSAESEKEVRSNEGEQTGTEGSADSSFTKNFVQKSAAQQAAAVNDTVQSDNAAEDEDSAEEEKITGNSTQGGAGTKKHVEDYVRIYAGQLWSCSYARYGYGNYFTVVVPVTDGNGHSGFGVCLDPDLSGAFMSKGDEFEKVYRLDAPMIVKCLYYGDGGQGHNYAAEVFAKSHNGSTKSDGVQILTHCALAKIYEDLQLNYKSSSSAWKYRTSELLQEDVEKYIAILNEQPTPEDYYAYVASDGRKGHQDFAFAAIGIEMASVQLEKVSSNKALTNLNGLYSPEGATFGIYRDKELNEEAAELTVRADGQTEVFKYLPEGTYYVRELSAPAGFYMDEEVHAFELKGGEVNVLELSDEPVADTAQLRIGKRSADGTNESGTLAGTQFTVKHYGGYYNSPEDIPEDAPHRTWILETREDTSDPNSAAALLEKEYLQKGSDPLYKLDGKTVLPLGTLLIEETKAPAGYEKDAVFSDSFSDICCGGFFLGQIRRNADGISLYTLSADAETQTADSENAASGPADTVVREDGIMVTDTPVPVEKKTAPVPSIGTSAREETGGQRIAQAGSKVTIVDHVTYQNLEPGETYILEGVLVNRTSGEQIESADGKPVISQKKFTCEEENGSVDISFIFDAPVSLAGQDAVVFEILSKASDSETGTAAVAEHRDPDDEEQTIHFPSGKTTALGKKSSSHEEKASGSVTIVDTFRYENLIPGLTYTVKGRLMVKETGKELTIENEKVQAETTFVPKESSGSCRVIFTFDGSDLESESLVAFEQLQLTSSETVVLRHEDLSDEEQTVRIIPAGEDEEAAEEEAAEEEENDSGSSNSPKTGDNSQFAIWLCLLGLAGIGAGFLLKKRSE